MITDRKITAFSQPVSSLADKPQMSAEALKAVFDSNTTKEVKTALNGLIDDLSGPRGAENIGWGESTVADRVLSKDNTAEYTPAAPYHPATKAYVDNKVLVTGAADMTQAVYDPDGDGTVNDSDKLGGQVPAYYATAGNLAVHAQNNAHWYLLSCRKEEASHLLSCDEIPHMGLVNVYFTPDADYTYGDSLLFGSDSLTARKSNGEPLASGDFISGVPISALIDMDQLTINFKSGGMPAGVFANQKFFSANETFTVPKTGKYHIVCAGGGGNGGHGDSGTDDDAEWWAMGGSGGSGGVAVKDVILTAGQTVNITAGFNSSASFGAYCTAVKGGNGGNGSFNGSAAQGGYAGSSGSASGGDVNYVGHAGKAGSGAWTYNIKNPVSISSTLPTANTELTSSSARCPFASWDLFGVFSSGLPMCSEGGGCTSTSGWSWDIYRGAIGGVLVQWN